MKRRSGKYSKRLVFTVFEAAEALALAPATVRKAIRSGALDAIVINGRYRVPVDKLDEFICKHRRPKQTPSVDVSSYFEH
jgi:excisionase family DNA binding protein